jgi:hypothetical protein
VPRLDSNRGPRQDDQPQAPRQDEPQDIARSPPTASRIAISVSVARRCRPAPRRCPRPRAARWPRTSRGQSARSGLGVELLVHGGVERDRWRERDVFVDGSRFATHRAGDTQRVARGPRSARHGRAGRTRRHVGLRRHRPDVVVDGVRRTPTTMNWEAESAAHRRREW